MLTPSNLKLNSMLPTFHQLRIKNKASLEYFCPRSNQDMTEFLHFNRIIYALKGKLSFHQRDLEIQVPEGSAIFIKGRDSTTKLTKVEKCEVISFDFTDDFLIQFFKEYRSSLSLNCAPESPSDYLLKIHGNELIRTFFYSILPYFNQSKPPEEGHLELKFRELFFDIFTSPKNRNFLAYASGLTENSKQPIWEVMENNYRYNLKIPEYARISDRSVSAFKRDFQEYYKTTPGKWLRTKRLEYAKKLLETSAYTISELAFMSGFENLSHFSRIFKSLTGLSPTLYREIMIAA